MYYLNITCEMKINKIIMVFKNIPAFISTLPSKHLGLTGLLKHILIGSFTGSLIIYVLFQKKLLPKSVSKIVSKVFFYPTFPITIASRLGNYWNKVDDTLLLGCAPMAVGNHPKILHDMNVKGVVNMCYEYHGPTWAYTELDMTQLHLPVIDHYEPPVEYMIEAVNFIQKYHKKGDKVYVHCKAGHGRGAAIALCWLIHQNPTTSIQELNQRLCKIRRVRKTLYKQPNIIEYHRRLLKTTASTSQQQ